MTTTVRKCPDCGEDVEGRPNKIFCNEGCKGRHFRRLALADSPASSLDTPGDDVPAPYTSAYEPPIAWEEEEDETEEDEAEDRERVRQERLRQEQANTLHRQFCAFVRAVLEAGGKVLLPKRLLNLKREADRLISSYMEHPLRKTSHTQVKRRLKALYAILDTLQEAVEVMNTKFFWLSRDGSFEISAKWRKNLRELLLED